MNILVTAGNTQVLVDKVRCLTNIFTGRTGTRIALDALTRGHRVTLLTSHPEVIGELHQGELPADRWTVRPFRTFEDLQLLMEESIPSASFDAIVHSAAVSDYLFGGVYSRADGVFVDRAAGKIKSDEPELWLRLIRAPKLIDRVRGDWQFHGVLVKFKLEVGVSEADLLWVAERSRLHSGADLMAANTLEGAASWAFLGPLKGSYERLARSELSPRLLAAVEECHASRTRE